MKWSFLKLAFDLEHLPFQTMPFPLFISITYSHSLLKTQRGSEDILRKEFIYTGEESIAM